MYVVCVKKTVAEQQGVVVCVKKTVAEQQGVVVCRMCKEDGR